jgi:hypothetical protein
MPNGQAEKPFTITKEQILAKLWEFASIPPEQSNGRLKSQIAASQSLYEKGVHAPAIQRLSEIADMDASRTGGRHTDQKAAANALKEIIGSVKPDKSGVQ